MTNVAGDPRTTARWKRIRLAVLAHATHCAACGRPLRHDLKSPHPLSPSVDHIHPVALGGDPYDPGNVRAMHFGCNASLGARLGNAIRRAKLDRTNRSSRSW